MYAIETYGYIRITLFLVGIVLLITALLLWRLAKRMIERDKAEHQRFLIETYGIECYKRAASLSPQEMPDSSDSSTRKEVAS